MGNYLAATVNYGDLMTLHDSRCLGICAIWNFNLSANNIVMILLENHSHIGKSCTVAVPTSSCMCRPTGERWLSLWLAYSLKAQHQMTEYLLNSTFIF